jgi:transposase
MTDPIVGADIAKATFDIAVPLDKPGKYRTRAKLINGAAGFNEFKVWLDSHAPAAAVCMEATGIYHEALATFLHEQGVTVYVVNPAQVAYFAKSELLRTKTDRSDAKLIARFAASQASLRPWQPPTAAQRQLRALVYRLEDLEGMKRMEQNRLDVADATVVTSINEHLTELEARIVKLRKAIKNHIDSDPTLRGDRDLLQSIPGIGEKASSILLACVGDLRKFDDPGQLDAFVGLNATIRESGTYKGSRAISKLGSSIVRAKIYMCALSAMTHNPLIRTFVQRLRDRGKPHMVAIVAAMRKLLHFAWAIVRSGNPFDPDFLVASK